MRSRWFGNKPVLKVAGLVSFLFLFTVSSYFAPHYLMFSQKPEKSDAVILLVGSNYKARFREAQQLVHDGYADYLIIPAFTKVLRAEPNGSLTRVVLIAAPPAGAYKTNAAEEDTHLEIAQARRSMESLGLTSAIFTSSPYHMRRIKIIAGRVFSGTANTPTFKSCFVPSRYETPHVNSWFLNIHDLRFVLMEYSKIVWFLIYSNFYDISGAPT